ncbi:M20/M25/M40 family metallo-hydrolase [Haloquadratum walsbyi]|jgi:Cellulase M and related proteins|uniref:Cellulase M related protein n=1 Tax=Haloquadratum walsbyi J07HQW2 TaxID=1238425 RepID=U1PRZ3_9EURY|nr:M20/M25/M40 family metallo-hydrolase [Haloquadratum walsbyi]ERG95131.1 MAG: cellulase M related protein [Haloquadratum walsbyi J07HQW2]
MDDTRREFLTELLTTPSPSGFETSGQRVWVKYAQQFADEVSTDAYGNAVAVYNGDPTCDVSIAFAGHADEIGYIIRDITDDGYLRINRIGGADRTVSKGQHVTVHAETPVAGVIGQTAIHLRDTGSESYDDIDEQFVDIGAEDGDDAHSRVEVGDPVTVETRVRSLADTRLAARALDNRVGTWAAAEALRAAATRTQPDATVYAVSTVQEEVGVQGAKMVGFDLDPDAAVAIDVTHATDNPDIPGNSAGPVELGSGPVVTRGSVNHPTLVTLARDAADTAEVDIQLQAAGSRTGTDADAFYTSRSGIPALNIGIPNRYMHTPVEVVDTTDLDAIASLTGAMAASADDAAPFKLDI